MHGPRDILSWLHYPLVMTLGYILFAVMQAHGVSLILSTYVPILITATIVMLLEAAFPHRAAWRPVGS